MIGRIAEDHGEDHQRLDDHDPGRFDELRVGERQHQRADLLDLDATGPPLSSALALRVAGALDQEADALGDSFLDRRRRPRRWSRSGRPGPRRRSSGRGARRRRGRSRRAAAGARNFSGGFSSVIGPAQRSRYVPRAPGSRSAARLGRDVAVALSVRASSRLRRPRSVPASGALRRTMPRSSCQRMPRPPIVRVVDAGVEGDRLGQGCEGRRLGVDARCRGRAPARARRGRPSWGGCRRGGER